MAETMSYAEWKKARDAMDNEIRNKHEVLLSSAEAKNFMRMMEQIPTKGKLVGDLEHGYQYIDTDMALEAAANALTAWDYVAEQKKRMEQGPKIKYHLLASRNCGKTRMLYDINQLIATGVDENTAVKTVLNKFYGTSQSIESITSSRFLTPEDVKRITAYVQNDVVMTSMLYEKENNMKITKAYGEPLRIKEVIFNNPATIVFWNDDTKTIVKANDDAFDPEKGLAMAITKKFLGNKGNYYNELRKWLPKKDEEQEETHG